MLSRMAVRPPAIMPDEKTLLISGGAAYFKISGAVVTPRSIPRDTAKIRISLGPKFWVVGIRTPATAAYAFVMTCLTGEDVTIVFDFFNYSCIDLFLWFQVVKKQQFMNVLLRSCDQMVRK